jgi:hypothetical protein
MAKQNAIGVPATVDVGGTGATTLTGVLTGNGTSAITANAVTEHGVLIGGASNAVSSTAVGTAGDVLTSNGAGMDPTYQTPTAGTVTSVSGTSNRISSTGGATPVIDIDAAYVGQSSITTLGTITTGTWNGTDVAVSDGGSGRSSSTAYAVICGGTTTTAAHQSIASVGTVGQVLTSNGAAALPTFQAAGGGITTLAGDSGTATGSTVTFDGTPLTGGNGSTVGFSAAGSTVTLNLTDAGVSSIFLGTNAGNTSSTGTFNACIGGSAMTAINTGGDNNAVGGYALASSTSASDNCSMGKSSLRFLTSGARNTCIGHGGGSAYTSSESDNICLGSGALGIVTESNVLRIGGSTGTGSSQLNKSFIHGIRGTTTANADAVAVLVDSDGQLGTVSSSLRFKENVVDMGIQSASVMNLRPVKFNFKDNGREGYGLIAEEVNEVFPYLCATQPQTKETEDGPVIDESKESIPFSVKYHELPALLLNEMQKMAKRIEDLEKLVQ